MQSLSSSQVLTELPFDIIYAILEWLDLETAKAATLVSRDFYSLWRHWRCYIVARDDAAIEAATRFLSGSTGKFVHELGIYFKSTVHASDFVVQNLIETIARCPELKRLQILTGRYNRVEVADALQKLDSFASRLEDYTSNLDGAEGSFFFSLHKQLKSLDIMRHYTAERYATPLLLPTPLPTLSKIVVSTAAHLYILQNSPVISVELRINSWDSPSVVLSTIIKGSVPLERLILRFSGQENLTWYEGLVAQLPSLRFLSVLEESPDVGALQVDVIASLPQLKSFSLGWDSAAAVWGSRFDNVWDDIPSLLRRCKALRRLEITAYGVMGNSDARGYERETSSDDWSITKRTHLTYNDTTLSR